MPNESLQLGVSSASLSHALPKGLMNVVWNEESIRPDLASRLVELGQMTAAALDASEIKHIEFFTTAPMMALGTSHPWMAFPRALNKCRIWSVHAPFGAKVIDLSSPDESFREHSVEILKRSAEVAADVGARTLVIHPGPDCKEGEERPTRLKASIKSIQELADFCAPLGVRVAAENMPKDGIGNSVEELNFILENADRPNTGFCLDTNHNFPASALPDMARAMQNRLLTLHCCDHDERERHWLPTTGVIDWRRFVRTLHEINYREPFVYEVQLIYITLQDAIREVERTYREIMGN